ncbi:hypothetical protein DAMA08_010940 [Martiniozyma asiatica (nom. inval.)]|nr:hypothetical protein DAMA08_010940 [Martiniozyma asiatica]
MNSLLRQKVRQHQSFLSPSPPHINEAITNSFQMNSAFSKERSHLTPKETTITPSPIKVQLIMDQLESPEVQIALSRKAPEQSEQIETLIKIFFLFSTYQLITTIIKKSIPYGYLIFIFMCIHPIYKLSLEQDPCYDLDLTNTQRKLLNLPEYDGENRL